MFAYDRTMLLMDIFNFARHLVDVARHVTFHIDVIIMPMEAHRQRRRGVATNLEMRLESSLWSFEYCLIISKNCTNSELNLRSNLQTTLAKSLEWPTPSLVTYTNGDRGQNERMQPI